MSDNTGINVNFGRVTKGVGIGLIVFLILELLCALLIHKEVFDISRISLLTYIVIFGSVFTAAFWGSGESKTFIAAIICGVMFLAVLFCVGLILYRGIVAWNKLLFMSVVSFVAAFCAALAKGLFGVKYVCKKH
ncbi:MAG: TIGR04086 family membrane protein [Clostridia bacterium]|nr:TIGR04086 family membrane protein [Clostridia bacterium]